MATYFVFENSENFRILEERSEANLGMKATSSGVKK